MMFPHTITLFNKYENPTTFVATYFQTVIKNVFIDAQNIYNSRTEGTDSADSVTLYVPYDPKKYMSPKKYEKLSEKERKKHYTFTSDDFFVKGEIVAKSDMKFNDINANFDDVYKITKIDLKDFGTIDLQHFQIGGA